MSKKEGKNAKSEANRKDIDFVEHTWPTEQLCAHFETHTDNGLTAAGYRKNVERFGRNQLTPPKQLPAWIKFLLQFANFFSGLLIAGGILCFVAFGIDRSDKSNLYLAVVLLTVVIITAVFSHFQESKSEKLMEGFKNLIPRQCKVVRDGSTSVVEAVDLVPGDLVLLEDGQQVPADIRVLVSNDLKVDNSSLTGESEPQDRTPDLAKDSNGNLVTQPLEARNLCFYTTMVAGGNGKGIVIGTGDRTVMGQIAGLTTETDNEETPIRKEIKIFIKLISAVAITLGIVFLIIGFFLQSDQRVKNVVFCIGIIVANVPEGLLLTVTVSLAATAMRMHEKNVLVKNLESVETLGSTTVIASDKTGTLTQNRMTVQHAWYDGQIVRCPSCRNLPQFDAVMKAGMKGETMCNLEAPTFQKLSMVAAVCNNSTFQVMNAETGVSINLQEEMRSTEFNLLQLPTTGDASESGLIKFVNLLRDIIQWRAAMPKLFEIKFNSTNKWQLSIHRPEDGSPTPVLVLKGAPERVIKMCNKILINGEEVSLSDAWLSKFTTAYEALGGMGERVLGFAYKNMHGHNLDYPYTAKPEPNFKFDDLTFAGLFSLIDPPKEGVPEAVAKCKNARIKVYMVTGDHPITAVAIAKQVGIIDQDKWDSGNATVVKGDDIREWMELEGHQRQTKFDEALSHEQIVWARVSPAHKLLIVENAQRRGEVVAVTGDGVNDAPALKKGDIGVAMGISGKDVSKEAADMILLDDNFASIVNGVEEGRLIFDNLKKSISYTLTSNIPEIAPFLCFITIQIPLPLSTVLILCVDLGTDMIPAISMAHEEKEADIMERPPRNSATDRLVNAKLISFAYAQIGIMQACAGFFTYMVVLNDYGFPPQILLMTGFEWEENQLICDMNGKARPHYCGFGCNDPEEKVRNADGVEVLTAFGQSKEDAKNTDGSGEFCLGGCATPLPGFADPFVEFTSQGFRGFEYDGSASSAEEAVCGRSCDWYWRVRGVEGEVERLIAASETVDNPNRYILTRDDLALFGQYCGNSTNEDVRFWGFPGRDHVDGPKDAPTGGYYWWNGEFQVWPNSGYQKNVLFFAQSAYFTSIVVVQWADLIISKTRKLSVFQQGMTNRFMNFGLIFETILALVFNYVPPLNQVFGTRPLHALHWFPGVPWSMLIFTYDETRKYLMRSNPGGFLDTYTYW